ncbi:hypothetical protein FRC03_002757 [Tulasnella sp. 419]|nr:hypothetical protein FRC03_002757 [Tulasnella sp. 419]
MGDFRPEQFTKVDLTPKRWHFYTVLLFILGTLFPPLAVAARFGFGKDFWLNLILTICGYIPGHGHNFYIQNIRNNKNHRRTPKWALKYGLIDDTAMKRRAKRAQWASRYNERLPQSALEGQEFEDGQIPDRNQDATTATTNQPKNNDALWSTQDEGYYGQRKNASSGDVGSVNTATSESHSGRWHYPANFEQVEPPSPLTPTSSRHRFGKKSKSKKDRWARTEDAHNMPAESSGKKKKKRSKRKTVDGSETWDRRSSRSDDTHSIPEEPEDAVGGLYGERRRATIPNPDNRKREEDDALNHQF